MKTVNNKSNKITISLSLPQYNFKTEVRTPEIAYILENIAFTVIANKDLPCTFVLKFIVYVTRLWWHHVNCCYLLIFFNYLISFFMIYTKIIRYDSQHYGVGAGKAHAKLISDMFAFWGNTHLAIISAVRSASGFSISKVKPSPFVT